ncbi:MAG: hypothetical protein KAI55_04555 [Candidatus Aenigmarchaeota archaeon]|nr:hypothetical protein [Candidatus Aenigmarchaeota archaeon]
MTSEIILKDKLEKCYCKIRKRRTKKAKNKQMVLKQIQIKRPCICLRIKRNYE